MLFRSDSEGTYISLDDSEVGSTEEDLERDKNAWKEAIGGCFAEDRFDTFYGNGLNSNIEELIRRTADFSKCPRLVNVPISSCRNIVTCFCARVIAV